jgi:hypothetical protein
MKHPDLDEKADKIIFLVALVVGCCAIAVFAAVMAVLTWRPHFKVRRPGISAPSAGVFGRLRQQYFRLTTRTHWG